MADPSISAATLTRADLREELDRSLAHFGTKEDLADQRAEVMTEIANLRADVMSEIANLRADLIKWMIGFDAWLGDRRCRYCDQHRLHRRFALA